MRRDWRDARYRRAAWDQARTDVKMGGLLLCSVGLLVVGYYTAGALAEDPVASVTTVQKLVTHVVDGKVVTEVVKQVETIESKADARLVTVIRDGKEVTLTVPGKTTTTVETVDGKVVTHVDTVTDVRTQVDTRTETQHDTVTVDRPVTTTETVTHQETGDPGIRIVTQTDTETQTQTQTETETQTETNDVPGPTTTVTETVTEVAS